MTDYTKLIEALRCCTQNSPKTCVGCTYNIGNNECAVRGMMCDAAAAIEDLEGFLAEAERDRDEYEERMRKEQERVIELQAEVKKAAHRNAELHAELEKWVSAAEQAGEPKRGAWINSKERMRPDMCCKTRKYTMKKRDR